ncbi:TPA: helix-turn-helix domain-containing protein [Stenotrophomonas maltophilia]
MGKRASDKAALLAEIGLVVAHRRKSLGWEQCYLATRAGSGQRTISQLETGMGGQMSIAAMIQIAEAIGLELKLVPRDDVVTATSFQSLPPTKKPTAFSVPRRLQKTQVR